MKHNMLILLSSQLALFSLSLLFESTFFVLNAELAWLAAILIIYTSYRGYKSYVMKNVDAEQLMHQRDILEQIEDPYELYDDEEKNHEVAESEIDEKKALKKESFKKMKKSMPGHLSKGRVFAYLFLVFAFIGLQNNHTLSVAGFLSGLTLGLIAAGLIGSKLK